MKELNTKQIEQNIIACMLVDISWEYNLLTELTNNDFQFYWWLFDYLMNSYKDWNVIDIVLLKEKINIDELKLDISEVIDWVHNIESFNLQSHIDNLKTRYIYKNLLKIWNKITNANFDSIRDWSIINEVIQELNNIEVWETYENSIFNILVFK